LEEKNGGREDCRVYLSRCPTPCEGNAEVKYVEKKKKEGGGEEDGTPRPCRGEGECSPIFNILRGIQVGGGRGREADWFVEKEERKKGQFTSQSDLRQRLLTSLFRIKRGRGGEKKVSPGKEKKRPGGGDGLTSTTGAVIPGVGERKASAKGTQGVRAH